MLMNNKIIAVLSAAGLLLAGCSHHQKSDLATLQGTWSGRQALVDHQCSLVISGNNYEMQDASDTNAWNKGTFTLRQDTDPRQFVFVIADCHVPKFLGATIMAIYRLEGDTLTVSWNAPGNPAAPSAFDAPHAARMELKRM